MNKDYVLSLINKCIGDTKIKLKTEQEIGMYKNSLIYLKEILSLVENDTPTKTYSDSPAGALNRYAFREIYPVDKSYSDILGEITHAYEVYFNQQSISLLKNMKTELIGLIDKVILNVQTHDAGLKNIKVIEHVIDHLSKLKKLLLNDEWPSKTYKETSSLREYANAELMLLRKKIVALIVNVCDEFDNYYDYLDPSYYQE